MPVIEIPSTVAPDQIDDFPASVKLDQAVMVEGKLTKERAFKRSCEGALYLRPGVKVVTADELAHLEKTRPALFPKLRFVALTAEERSEVKKSKKKGHPPGITPVPEPSPPPAPEPVLATTWEEDDPIRVGSAGPDAEGDGGA